MPRELATVTAKGTPAEIAATLEQLREHGLTLEARRRSPATRKVYDRELAAFEAWAKAHNLSSDLGATESVYGYLTYLSKLKALATVCKVAAVLSSLAQDRGYASPLKNDRVAALLEGFRRPADSDDEKAADEEIPATRGERNALQIDDLRKALAQIDRDSLLGKRDAAILLLGFVGALRRSELVALNFSDVRFDDRGATLTIRRSKTDQHGKSAVVPVPKGANPETCPVEALRAWVAAAEITSGKLLRSINRYGRVGPSLSARFIAETVKRLATRAKLKNVERLSAHSLRAGAATHAAKTGAARESIKRLGRWKSDVYERYIRFETPWEDAAAARFGM